MKTTRKLIPAIAMLIVSAVMLTTASYAWFTSNTQAQATNMVVQAQASGGLAIASYTANGDTAVEPGLNAFTNVAEMGWSNANDTPTLQPASFDGTTWTTASAATPNDGAAKADTYSVVAEGGEGFYLRSKWQIKSLADAIPTVYVTGVNVTIDSQNDYTAALKNSLRIAILANDEYTYFAPCYTDEPQTALEYVAYTAPVENDPETDEDESAPAVYTPTAVTGDDRYFYTAKPNAAILTGLDTDPAEIEIFVYFEGEDPYCMSAYALDAQDINVALTFSTTQVQ